MIAAALREKLAWIAPSSRPPCARLVIACLLALSVPAHAQQGGFGAPVGSTSTVLEVNNRDAAAKGQSVLRRLAACIYRKDRALTLGLLATAPKSPREDSLSVSLESRLQYCFLSQDTAMRVNINDLRGVFSEIAFAENFPGFTPAASHPIAELPVDWIAKPGDHKANQALASARFANCIAASDPESAASLLATTPFSANERSIIAKLTPSLGACLDNGFKLTADASSLRSLIAQGLYRSAMAWRLQSAAAAGVR